MFDDAKHVRVKWLHHPFYTVYGQNISFCGSSQRYSIHLSAVHTCITSQIVLLSPGRRLELLQVLRTEAVVAWQVYESPGAALQTGWRKTAV